MKPRGRPNTHPQELGFQRKDTGDDINTGVTVPSGEVCWEETESGYGLEVLLQPRRTSLRWQALRPE